VQSAFAGDYHSVFKGRGMNFEDVREYQPGDEIRAIDWNVTARSGDPFVKRYREERELTMLLVVDVSASGAFGSRARSILEMVVELAALLMFSALKNNDKVGLAMFCDEVLQYLPPRKGKPHVLHMIRQLIAARPVARETNLSAALEFVNRVQKRKAVVFLVSDFLDFDARRALAVANRRHDLVAVNVHDPRELALPEVGFVTLRDAETGELVEVDTRDRRARRRFAAQSRDRAERLSDQFKKLGIDELPIGTDEDYLAALQRFFRMRERRFR
jgi:uncharacterized protein (DUF58 family)